VEGSYTKLAFYAFDKKRVSSAENQVTEAARARRRRGQLAQAGLSTSDASYQAGGFRMKYNVQCAHDKL